MQSVYRLEPAYWVGVKLLEDSLYGAFAFYHIQKLHIIIFPHRKQTFTLKNGAVPVSNAGTAVEVRLWIRVPVKHPGSSGVFLVFPFNILSVMNPTAISTPFYRVLTTLCT